MSKTARAARPTTARKRTSVTSTKKRTPAKRTPAKRTATVAAKKKATGAKAPAKRAGTRSTTKTTKTTKKAQSVKKPERTLKADTPVKRTAKPRLPADVKLAVAAANDKLALDVTVLDLRDATAFTDFFIICTGANVKQVQAVADGIEASLREKGQKPALVEGYRRGEWVLLDYFDFIVHIFLPAQRTFYALERLWGGAEPIEISSP